MELFKSEAVTPSVTRITDCTGTHMYLARGTRAAALIDTGAGIGDLKSYVKTFTGLPLTVLCTHGHVDHAGGAGGFRQVLLSPLDVGLAAEHCTLGMRRSYAEQSGAAGLEDRLYQPQRSAPFAPLTPGQRFPLGGLTLEAAAFPGHTKGMMAIRFIEERIFLFGDGCNGRVFLFLPEADTVEEYRQALLKMKKREGEYDRVLLSHGSGEAPREVLEECIAVCGELLAGKSDRQVFDFPGTRGYLAKATDKDFNRLDGRVGNIVYHPDKIFYHRGQ